MTALHLGPCHRYPISARRAPLDGLADAGSWVWSVLRAWCRRSRERRELAGFNDRELADIGLRRGDIEILIHKPFWRE